MINLDNLVGSAKKALNAVSGGDLTKSANDLKSLASGAFSELTKNVDLLKSIDTTKPVEASNSAIGNIVKSLQTTAMSQLLKTGESSMAKGILQQLTGGLAENGSSLFSMLPLLIQNITSLKTMFSKKTTTENPQDLIKSVLDKAGPALSLLKLMK